MQISLFVLLALEAAPPIHAPLRLQINKCSDTDQATVSRVVAMELEAALADDGRGAITTATVECGDAQVRLTIDDPVTGKSTTRTLDLEGQTRSLRSRLLGLAISEAVLASWIELELTPAPPAPPPGEVASPETRRQATDIAERHLQVTSRVGSKWPREIAAGPAARWFTSGLLTLGLSGSARHWLKNHPLAGVELEIDGSYGEQSVANVARASATSLSLAPRLLMRSAFGRIGVMAGAGWRVGLARLSSEPASTLRSGRTALRGWTGPFLAVNLDVPLWRSFFLRASVESGYALVPARGEVNSVRVIALEGSWLGGLLSLGAAL